MAGAPPDASGERVEAGQGGAPPDLRGLAELAFGSLSRCDEATQGQPLALLHAERLELDLADPAQRQFGDYELLERIGEGGMGVVYRARHLPLDRSVAVKLLSAGPWASREFIARFAREAQHAARMQHPNIVTVYEAGSHEGLHFMSMRLVDGHSLSALLKRGGRYPPRQAAALMRTLAEAVAYAHSLGVLHLDLKPGNVLIGGDGVPYVADFGLARRLDGTATLENDEVSGTPSYMAPEQAEGRRQPLTAATDVWGLGAILYELLTGQPPFRADSAQATLRLVREGRVRAPRRLRPLLPRDLQAIALRCLGRDPGERYPSARALGEDLARYVEGRPVQARPLNAAQRAARWARREPKLAATALLAFGLLAGGLVATTQQWRRADANAEVAQHNAATASQRLWDSRDAASLAFMESGDGWKAAPLLLANLTEMEAQGDGARAAGVRKRLGVLVNQNPRLIDVLPVQKRPTGIALSPDGSRLAVSGEETGVRLFDTSSGKEFSRAMSHEGQANGVWNVLAHLQFAPDGRSLIATSAAAMESQVRPSASSMLRLDTQRGVWLDPPDAFADFLDASYNADGRYALLTDKATRVQFWSTDPWRPLSLLGKLPGGAGDGPRLIAPDGSFFVLAGPAHAVTLVDARSLRVRASVDLGEFDGVAAWAISPDSRWLALGDGAGHVKVIDSATHSVRTLQPRPSFGARWISFSEDGAWLAVAAGAGGVHLWTWPEGRLLAPPFGGNPSAGGAPLAQHVAVDRARGLVLTSDETDSTTVWQVAPTEFETDRSDALPVTARINARYRWGVEAIAWSPKQGLLASIAEERLRLERLPPPVLKTGRGATLKPATLRFDGRHLVEVEGSNVRIVDARTEQAIGTPFQFAQPPGFAELTADGATLVVTVGRVLRAFDVASGKPRFAPVELENSPSRVELSPDGRRVATTWLHHDEQGDRNVSEVAEIHDLGDGRRLGGPEALPGALNAITFSPDGKRLLAWNRRDMTLRDGTTLVPIAGPLAVFRPRGLDENAHHGYVPVAAFDVANRVEMAFGRQQDGKEWQFELRRYANDGSFRASPLPDQPENLLPLPGGGTAVLSGYVWSTIIAPDGNRHDLPDLSDDAQRFAAAVSADGRWFARIRRDGVALFDLHGRSRVATLRVALPRPDEVWQLAFSPDGNRLLARSLHNRYMVWDLEPDARPVAAIAHELALRDRATDAAAKAYSARDLDVPERAALRAQDPGPPPVVTTPFVAAPASGFPGGAVPPRDPATPPEALDLGAYYSFGLGAPFLALAGEYGDFSWLPGGTQCLLGTDYDLRGGVRLSLRDGAGAAGVPGARSAIKLPLHGNRVAAVRVLMLPVGGEQALAHVADIRFDYADGSSASVPAGFAEGDFRYWRKTASGGAAQMASYGWDARTLNHEERRTYASALRVPNPHPERPVSTLALVASEGSSAAQVILAVTVEPAPENPRSAASPTMD